MVLLPGLAADHRLFGPQRAVLPDLVVPPWPTPQAGDTLATFASRLAPGLPKPENLILGGASFGGMVALELASLVRPRAVVLIGSGTGRESIAPLLRRLGELARALPASAFKPRRWLLPLVLPMFGRLARAQRRLFWSMARSTSGSFIQWGVTAILSWRPPPPPVPVRHIHGSHDRLIPLARVRPDRVIDGGGHLLTLTHSREVNAFLEEAISGERRQEDAPGSVG